MDRHFPLKITIDPEGIEWTHFYDALGGITTLQELPDPLRRLAHPLMRFFLRGKVLKIQLLHRRMDRYRFNDLPGSLEDTPVGARDTLELLAWYMEWRRRRIAASWHEGGTWQCLECGDAGVTSDRSFCTDSTCCSRDMIHLITGETTLHPVPKTESA